MKVKSLLATAVLALGAVAAASASVTVGLGDLVLGFNKSSGTGSTQNLEVTLGSITNFLSGGTYATGSEVTLSQLSVNDLNSIYGSSTGSSGWKSSVTSWGVVGTNGAGGGNTLWGTQVSGEVPGSDQGAGANQIAAMYNGLSGKADTGNSAFAANVSTADTLSWKNTSSGNFSYWSSSIFKTNGTIGTTPAAINLFEYVQGASSATLLGTFRLYNTGVFTFQAVAIPEPSTYAALLGAVTLGVVAIRRRRQVAVEI